MIQHFNKILTPSLRAKKKNIEGQIAIIFVLFLAILLVVFSVVMNLGKVAQTKTRMQITSDTTAIFLSSALASLAESYYQEGFRGQHPGNNGKWRIGNFALKGPSWIRKVLQSVIDLAIAVACTVVPGLQEFAASAWVNFAGGAAETGVAIFGANKASKAWNKMFEGLDIGVQIREQGLSTALSMTVEDSVLVPDTGDYNMNGYFVGDETVEGELEEIRRWEVLHSKRIAYIAEEEETGIYSGQVIYAWRDEPKEEQATGPWHVVLAEAKIPTLCGGNCRRTMCVIDNPGSGPKYAVAPNDDCRFESDIPYILSKDLGSEYYFLLDYAEKGSCERVNNAGANYKYIDRCFKGGLTKARVIRYDQDKADSGILSFATGSVFWKNTAGRFGVTPSVSPDDIELDGYCGEIMELGAVEGAWGTEGAVLLGKPTPVNISCWNLMIELLKSGVESRSCAEYFYRDVGEDNSPAFGAKLADCADAPDPW